VVVVVQGEGVSADEGERTELVVELAGDQGCFVEPVGVGELWGAAGLVLGYLGTRRDRIWSLKKLIPEITV